MPSQTPMAPVKLFPDNPVSVATVVDLYVTLHHFKYGSSSKPIVIDDDEVSEALSDLTNAQMTKKKQTRVFYPAKMEGAVTGKEGFKLALENLKMSPNLLD
jgi:hypothetical protein